MKEEDALKCKYKHRLNKLTPKCEACEKRFYCLTNEPTIQRNMYIPSVGDYVMAYNKKLPIKVLKVNILDVSFPTYGYNKGQKDEVYIHFEFEYFTGKRRVTSSSWLTNAEEWVEKAERRQASLEKRLDGVKKEIERLENGC